MENSIKLNHHLSELLLKLPESGMGYQLVKVILKSGKTLRNHKVINTEWLILEDGERIKPSDIKKIEIESA